MGNKSSKINLSKNFLIIFFILLVLSLTAVSLSDKQIPATFFGGQELVSPSNWIAEHQIKVYKDKVVIDVKNAIWAGFTNTNSMDPLIDENAHAVEVMPSGPEKIKVGDIISYQTEMGVVIHRVIEVGEDDEGIYYIVKGDNNKFRDLFKVRFVDVQGVVVAIIY